MKSKTLFYLIITVIVALSILARFYDLSMDPFPYDDYGMGHVDEGGYTFNARNKALFDDWFLEGSLWNSIYISPIFTYLEYASLHTFGVNTQSMRLVPAVLGILSIFIASYFLMRKNFQAGMIYLAFLSINLLLIVYSRVATLQSLELFFILAMIGLIINDTNWSWLGVGLLIPCLIFTKLTSFFFILAIPLSLILYYWMCRKINQLQSKDYLKRLGFLILGGVISLSGWLIWLSNNFGGWLVMNQMMAHKLYLNFFKVAAVITHLLHFSYLNLILIILSIGLVVYFLITLFKQRTIHYLDLFLLCCLGLFLLQTLAIDFFLRRWVLIIPVVALLAVRAVLSLGRVNFSYAGKEIKLSRTVLISLILVVYLAANFIPILLFFNKNITTPEETHTIVRTSQELGEIIPEGEKVFGTMAIALGYENKIRPYYIYWKSALIDAEELFYPYFKENINYAVLNFDLFLAEDLAELEIDLDQSPIYKDIQDNFEIVETLTGKDWIDNSISLPIYIYERR